MFYINSCKIAVEFPKENQKLLDYLQKRWQFEVAGCCRLQDQLKITDRAVVICHTCASIMEEASKAAGVEYAWEYIAKDPDFCFPDFGGEEITLQDCYMARERNAAQEAVRQLLTKMNFKIVEQKLNRNEADFCGLRLQPMGEGNLKLAPKHFDRPEIAIDFSKGSAGLDTIEKSKYLQQHIEQYHTKRVVTYCGACYRALKQGGAPVVHILELLFSSQQ